MLLLKTTKDNTLKHTHIAYIRNDGTGITSKKNNHTHEILTFPVTITSIDENGNEVIETKQGDPKVQEAEGHVHTLEELKYTEVIEKELSDEDTLAKIHQLYKTGKELYADAYDDAEESEEFKKGNQWSLADKKRLDKDNRACITINEIKPKCDMLSGQFRQNRTDIALLPTEEGDVDTADIFNIRVKNICQQNNYEYKETKTFDDMVAVGVGYMTVNVVASNRGIGEVKVDNKYWKKGGIGPCIEDDGSDAEYAWLEDNVSLAKLKELYPEKADEIDEDFDFISKNKNVVPENKSDYYSGKGTKVINLTSENSDLVNVDKKNYKLIEVQHKVYTRSPILFNKSDDFFLNCIGINKSDIDEAKTIEELTFINSTSYKIKVSVFAGNVLLSNQDSLFSEINIVPFFANKIENYYWGKIHEAKDPQRELNKRHSQMIDIINKMSSYGIGVTSEAFESIADYNEFIKNRNKPGFVAKFKPGFKEHLYEFQGVKFPNEVVSSSQLNSEKINTIMNIYPEMLGSSSSSNVSGVAIAQKQRQGLVGNEYLFDNFSLSKRRVAKLMVEAIQIVDSPEKLLRIAENQNNNTITTIDKNDLYPEISFEEKLQLAQQTGTLGNDEIIVIQQMLQEQEPLPPEIQQIIDSMQEISNEIKRDKLLKALNNFELTQYDLVVSESTYSPTTRLSNFVILQDLMRNSGIDTSAEQIELIPSLDNKTKQKFLNRINGQRQQQSMEMNKKYDTEIEKSLIAAQSKQQQSGTPSQIMTSQ